MPHQTILITGACSGIGRAFFTHYSNLPNTSVIGLDIREESQSAANNPIYAVDISDAASIQTWAQRHASTPIDLVIHSAGIRGLVPAIEAANPADVAAAETLEAMDAATMLRTYQVNTLGTFQLIQAILPNLRLAAQKKIKENEKKPKVVIMSSRMGSTSYNSTGGGYAYRASKAALNAIVKSLSIDVPDVVFASVHPGRVETNLVKVKEEGAISVEESLRDMLALIERVGEEGEKGLGSGCFVDRWGAEIGF